MRGQKRSSSTTVLWGIYALILMVLLPHTIWMFSQFEDPTVVTIPFTNIVLSVSIVAVAGAVAFELGVGALTDKLINHVNDTKLPRNTSEWARFKAHYLNIYGIALLMAITVSAVANLTHAYSFATPDAPFFAQPLLKWGYVILYGLTLPLTAAMFVAIIAKIQTADVETGKVSSQEVNKLHVEVKTLRQQLTENTALFKSGNAKVIAADKVLKGLPVLLNGNKTEIIEFLLEVNPGYTRKELQEITGASPSLLSKVIKKDSTSEL